MFRAATMLTAFLIGLGIFYCPCQLDHELLNQPPQFHQHHHSLGLCHHWPPLPLDEPSGWWVFFESGWLPLSYFKGKKLVVLCLGDHQQLGFWSFEVTLLNLPSQPPWWPLGNLNMFSPVDPPSDSLPLLLITWEFCHSSNPSSALPHDLGENSQGRKLLVLAKV